MSTAPIHGAQEPSVQVENVTPEVAQQYLALNTHNRNLRQRVVRGYAHDMKNGDWEWNGESIKFSTEGALLDGQHRLAAIVDAGVAVPMLVIRNLPALTQETMDTGAKRSFGDILRLRGEASYVTLAATVRGITAWEAGVTYARGTSRQFTNRELLHTLDKHPWIRDGLSTIRQAAASPGLPAVVGGVLWWAFMEIDGEDAAHFFTRLISDENHTDGDPITTLRRLLLQSTDGVRGARNTRYLLAVTIKAWNKYRAGEPADRLMFRMGGAKPEPFPTPR